MNGVTVIVCCYNSAKRLPETIKHLAYQNVPPEIPWEVIIVNNASTDNTVEVAKNEWAKYKREVPFKIVDQPKPGLSYAREKGIEVSRFEYLIFCDDDNWLDENYVKNAFEIMESNTKMGALGGTISAVYEEEPPSWFYQYTGYLAIGDLKQESGEATSIPGFLYGAGICLRKQALNQVNKIQKLNLLSDRKGNELYSGGDSELCFKLRLSDWILWYSKELKLKHHMPKERLNWDYIKKLFYGFGKSGIYLLPYISLLNSDELHLKKSRRSWVWHYLSQIKYIINNFYTLINIKNKKYIGDFRVALMYEKLGRMNEVLKIKNEFNKNFKILLTTYKETLTKYYG